MTTYFTDAFTGSNGASWNASNWTASSISTLNTAGATATIQGNRGRLFTGSVASYGGKVARRYAGTNQADLEMSGKIIFNDAIDGQFQCWIRASTSAIDGTGYAFTVTVGSSDNVTIIRANSYSYTTIGTASVTISQGSEYNWKHYCVGNTHKAKVWTGSEPAYNVDVSDSVVTAAGYAYVIAVGGGSAGFDVDIDDVSLTDGTGGAAATYTGSVTATGTIHKIVTKNPFTGSITASSTWSYIKIVERLFTSSVTATGALVKGVVKSFAGFSTAESTMTKQAQKRFAGSITGTGFFQKNFIRVFTGTITAVGASTITFVGRVFGRPGRVKTTVTKAGEVRMRIRRG
jgi:hypothetical protein